jgi:chromate transporter
MGAHLDVAEEELVPTRLALFLTFLKIGLLGFGGVGPWARHVIVEERGWLDEREYAGVLGLCQVLPGPNVGNVAVSVGDRFQGGIGAILSLTGLLTGPLTVLLVLVGLYDRFSDVPSVHNALGGVASAAAGLVIGTAFKTTERLNPTRVAVLFGLLAFLGIGILRLPLIAVVVALAPLSIVAAHRTRS